MGRMRIAGIILIGIGILLTAIAGFWLATESGLSGLAIGDLILRAVVFFAIVAPIVIAGLYLYSRGENELDVEPNEDMVLQRNILDSLAVRESMSFASLAQKLNVTEAEIAEEIASMTNLAIFNGYVDWSSGTILRLSADDLLSLTQCLQCHAPIVISPSGQTVCRNCNCEYSVI